MYEKFTDQARQVMQLANKEAQRYHHEYIGTEHILLGLIQVGEGVAAGVRNMLGVSLPEIRLEVEKIIQSGSHTAEMGKRPQTPRAKKVIEFAIEEARTLRHEAVDTHHLLLGLFREEEGVAAQVLMNLGLKLETVRDAVLQHLGQEPTPRTSPPIPKEVPLSPEFDRCGRDLTARARRGELDPVVGRERDIERILMVLGCRTQNVPLLVGPAGVGKSSLVRGMALASGRPDAPHSLHGLRVIALSLARLILLTKDRGDLFAEAIWKLTDECRQHKGVLLFLEDVFSFGSSGKLLLSALVAEKVPCLLATTPDQYSALTIDPVIGRHCQRIHVEPPSPEQTVEILRAHRPALEEHHHVRIEDGVLPAAVHAAGQYLTEGVFPGTALQLLGNACSLARLNNEPRRPDLRELERRLELLNFEKEAAVAQQDFDKAARLRDEADILKKRRLHLFREWYGKTPVLTVTAEVIGQAVRKMSRARD